MFSKMSRTANSVLVTLAILFIWRVEKLAEACSCSPAHPQQAFCNSDVVIRARVVGSQVIDAGNDIYGNAIKRVQYDVKMIKVLLMIWLSNFFLFVIIFHVMFCFYFKVFKGPNRNFDMIYTAPTSAVCGVTLETNSKEYLIAGKLESDGTMHVTLCDFIEPWEGLSATQKKSLVQRYEMGCDCKITHCTSIPCTISGPAECLWTDWVIEKSVNGNQAKHFACIKRSDDSCAWYRGSAPPKKDFLDIEDP
ncbi:hypothetical protein NQD34_006376 [Periophthalmus magnuspinnatus]|nr:hypothetical protein NQD34_006376 [Periophthalmus magnuspinnatus]